MGKKTDRDVAIMIGSMLAAIKNAVEDILDLFVIVIQPDLTQEARIGDIIRPKVVALNVATYQWQYSTNGTTWRNANSPGYNTNQLTITVDDTTKDYYRRCKLTNSDGDIIYTNVGKLTIIEEGS